MLKKTASGYSKTPLTVCLRVGWPFYSNRYAKAGRIGTEQCNPSEGNGLRQAVARQELMKKGLRARKTADPHGNPWATTSVASV
jgi:hypothetical protein